MKYAPNPNLAFVGNYINKFRLFWHDPDLTPKDVHDVMRDLGFTTKDGRYSKQAFFAVLQGEFSLRAEELAKKIKETRVSKPANKPAGTETTYTPPKYGESKISRELLKQQDDMEETDENVKNKAQLLENIRKNFNETLDEKIETARINECYDKIGCLSLCQMDALMRETVDKIYESKNGTVIIGRYTAAIKNNPALKTRFGLYETFRKGADVRNTSDFVKESIEMTRNFPEKSLKEGKKMLAGIVAEGIKASNITSSEFKRIIEGTTGTVNEAIDFLSENKTTLHNLNKVADAVTFLSENITKKDKDTTISENYTVSDLLGTINECEEKWEREAIGEIATATLNGNGAEIFENVRKSCIDAIDKIMKTCDMETKTRLSGMKDKLIAKKYAKETLAENILKLRELKNTLENEE